MRRSTSLRGIVRLELLDAHEVLLVERAQPLDARLQLLELSFDLRSNPSRLERRHLEVVEAHRRVPVVEAEVLVARAREGLGVGELEVARRRSPTSVIVLPSARSIRNSVRLAGRDGARALVVALRVDVELEPVIAVLVEAREHVLRVLPAAEDREVARRVRVARAGRAAPAVAPELDLEIAVGRPRRRRRTRCARSSGSWRSSHTPRLRAPRPQSRPPLILHVGLERVPVGAELAAIEVVLERRGDGRPGRRGRGRRRPARRGGAAAARRSGPAAAARRPRSAGPSGTHERAGQDASDDR